MNEASTQKPSLWARIDAWLTEWVGSWNPYDPEKLEKSELKPVVIEESSIRKSTFKVLFFALSLFMVWASFAPLDNGVHMTGNVVIQGHRKAVQHPHGGVVTELMIKEGQRVKEGQILIRVNPLGAEASLNQTELDYFNLMAEESRLLAERLNYDNIRWIPEFSDVAADDARSAQVKLLQTQLFNSRRQEFQTQQSILNEQIASNQKQLRELGEVLLIKKEQLASLAEEAKSNRELAKEGYVSVAKANEVERHRSDLLAAISNLNSEITRSQTAISAAKLQLIQQRSAFLKDVDTRLAEAQKNRKSTRSKVESLTFDRDLAEVKAPIAGTVVGLKVFTEGGVIKGGDLLMEVVPENGNLIIEAHVPPQYIDKVRVGLTAFTRFTAFNVNTTPVVDGVVELVAPDKTHAPDGKEEFYLAHIKTTEGALQRMEGLQVQPGMPVEIVVKTGERTFMSYLLKPLSDRVSRSFKDPF
jgi:protease secretion system membrane fusion protein